jgi:adenylyl cyclase-associated protein
MLTRRYRLEAATSRLEDIATTVDGAGAIQNGTPSQAQHAAAIVPIPEESSAPTPAPPEPLPRSIEDFDKLIEEDITAFVTASGKIGGLVEEQVRTFKETSDQH